MNLYKIRQFHKDNEIKYNYIDSNVLYDSRYLTKFSLPPFMATESRVSSSLFTRFLSIGNPSSSTK